MHDCMLYDLIQVQGQGCETFKDIRTYIHLPVHLQKVFPIRMKFGMQVEVNE